MIAKHLTSGMEDYIETIYVAQIEGVMYKGAELARKLNVSRSSVSEALGKLVKQGLVEYNSYQFITLTQSGIMQAKRIFSAHNALKDFFVDVLDLPLDVAANDACKIEHIISQEVMDKIMTFTQYCKKNEKILKGFKEGN